MFNLVNKAYRDATVSHSCVFKQYMRFKNG